VVRPDDTLYSIAWRHDLDFRDLARWNNIGADFRISVGQVLVLGPGRESPAGRAAPRTAPKTAATPTPAPTPPSTGAAARSHAQETPQVSTPRPLPESSGTGPPSSPSSPSSPNTAGTANPSVRRSTPSSPGPSSGRDTSARNSPAGEAQGTPGVANGALRWVWPTDRAGAPRPVPGGGILLSGRLGQDVRAASAGRVVYAGSGLRGYGNLIIIKHADSVLSAYAHNRELLVRDGQEVAMGQVIAHMGEGPQQSAILYFEIRQNGRPVDPLPFLPKAK
jgi:lipoprotein NlpD